MNQFVYKSTAARQFKFNGICGCAVTGDAGRSTGDVALISVQGSHGKVKDIVSDRFYVVTEGSGKFVIEEKEYPVQTNDVVVIPPNTVYDFMGEMKLVMFCSPPFNPHNDVFIS